MQSYISVDMLKGPGVLNITGAADDERLRSLAEAVSRMVDGYCNRHFYALSAARTFDGEGALEIPVPDLIGIDAGGLETDEDGDRTFETAWTAADYLLLPSNADPAAASNPASRPYTRIAVDVGAGGKRAFPAGRQNVRITGQWGWWRRLCRAAGTVDAIADTAASGIAVSDQAGIEAGHTLLIGAEQVYVRSRSGGKLTVVRGVNGTTAAPHDAGSAVDVYRYPEPIVEAAIMQTARLWKRKDSAFVHGAGLSGTAAANAHGRVDPDVMAMLGPYRKPPIGA